jgi:hypothetical protein
VVERPGIGRNMPGHCVPDEDSDAVDRSLEEICERLARIEEFVGVHEHHFENLTTDPRDSDKVCTICHTRENVIRRREAESKRREESIKQQQAAANKRRMVSFTVTIGSTIMTVDMEIDPSRTEHWKDGPSRDSQLAVDLRQAIFKCLSDEQGRRCFASFYPGLPDHLR